MTDQPATDTTPGEWIVAFTAVEEIGGLNLTVSVAKGEGNFATVALISPMPKCDVHDVANAHMMSAAKELYAVLKPLVAHLGAAAPAGASAAIAKAEGRKLP